MAAATATVLWNLNTWVASSTRPAYTPTSSPVTIAYASVRLMIRSMSYSRYRRIATPIDTGSATMPNVTTLANAHAAPEALSRRGQAETTRATTATSTPLGQPLELLAALTGGPPPGHDLAGHPQRQQRHADRGEHRLGPREPAGRTVDDHQPVERVELHVMAGDRPGYRHPQRHGEPHQHGQEQAT